MDSGSSCEPRPAIATPRLDPGPGIGGVDHTVPSTCTDPWVAAVHGHVESPTGALIAGARTQLCLIPSGRTDWVCLVPPTTDASGEFAILVGDPMFRCLNRATMRVLLPQSGNATTYCQLDLTPDAAVLELTVPVPLYPVEPAPCTPPVGDRTMPRTVTLGAGVELVDLRPEQIDGYPALAASRYSLEGSCIAGHEAPFLGAYGFLPESDVAGGVAVRFPNATNLPAGTQVELWVLGGLSTMLMDGTPVGEGEWARVGTGTVNSDASMIASDPGTLLPVLSWLAYRAAT